MTPRKSPISRRVLIAAALAAAFAAAYMSGGSSPVAALAATATSTSSGSLQDQIDAQNAKIDELNQKIAEYQSELLKIGADKRTLQQAISALDIQRNKMTAQVAAMKSQINVTELQIQQLGDKIQGAQQAIAAGQDALVVALRNIQENDGQSFLSRIFSSDSFSGAWSNLNAVAEAQNAIVQGIQSLREKEEAFANTQTASREKKGVLAAQQQALASQQQALTATQHSKTELLAQTNQKQSNYEKLLAQAEEELQSFSAFTQNAGGSNLVGNQTVCDAWGCYYNQRDAAWGNDPLDGTKYTLASDGCLITSMAMVMTHYGYRDVTPVTINTNPSNFAAYYPAYLLMSINVDGVTATRKSTTIDATLATGNPVIIGLKVHGGTHFIVLVSGRRGNYIMRDPYYANGNNASFASRYSMRNIFSVAKVVIEK